MDIIWIRTIEVVAGMNKTCRTDKSRTLKIREQKGSIGIFIGIAMIRL